MSCDRAKPRKLIDKISELPDNVIDMILTRMPLRDAARTSILSTRWRPCWTMIESLVLDEDFFDSVLGRAEEYELVAYKYASIVGSILLSHVGPIRKFLLYVPEFKNSEALGIINLWILAASRGGVQDLTLEYNSPFCYKCPSSVFQCKELNHLSLDGVDLELPLHNFRKLSSLRSLDLCCVSISGDVLGNMFLNCPLLQSFTFHYSEIRLNDGPFIISAPKLERLVVAYDSGTDFILKNIPKISMLSLTQLNDEERIEDVNGFQGINDFFGAVPKVEDIEVTSDVLAQWRYQDIPERLSTPLENHLYFFIHNLDMYSPGQIHAMLCLIKSSRNLKTLTVEVRSNRNESHDTTDYLRSQVSNVQELWNLRRVKVSGLMGMEPEIVFIQLILSCCPMLETLYFGISSNITPGDAFKMMEKIVKFRRASTKAELIYLEPGQLI